MEVHLGHRKGKRFPLMMERKVEGHTTILASLTHATSPNQLAYLQNFGLFVAKHPHIDVMYGTTRNEAFHKQLLSFFRNVMFQTSRKQSSCVRSLSWQN